MSFGIKALLKKFKKLSLKRKSNPISRSWSDIANCYAYAVNCKFPKDGNIGGALPGMTKDFFVFYKGDEAKYISDLVRGAELDGLKQAAGTIDKPPAAQSGFYLVALLANKDGFHWMRRDEKTGAWSWKDGNGFDIIYKIYKRISDSECKIVQIIDGTENNLASLLDDTKKDDYIQWGAGHMQFVSFFMVPNEGLVVCGRPKKSLSQCEITPKVDKKDENGADVITTEEENFPAPHTSNQILSKHDISTQDLDYDSDTPRLKVKR